MANQDWGIAVIGLGGISRSHLEGYRRQKLNVIGGMDVDPERRRASGLEITTGDADELISRSDVKVVDITTPHSLQIRRPLVESAARHGKAIFIQKPLLPRLDEARILVEIAEAAGVSTGNVYHHFPDKETIFTTLLDELWTITDSRRFPFRRALVGGQFPDNLELLGAAARDSVREFRKYFALVYVDVIEFKGTHIQKLYGDMATRFADLLGRNGGLDRIAARLRPGVSPISAVLLTQRIFFSYFTIEILFNVPEPFGKDSAQVVQESSDILRKGIVG